MTIENVCETVTNRNRLQAGSVGYTIGGTRLVRTPPERHEASPSRNDRDTSLRRNSLFYYLIYMTRH